TTTATTAASFARARASASASASASIAAAANPQAVAPLQSAEHLAHVLVLAVESISELWSRPLRARNLPQ
ncbi:MAG: hypothetical protein ABGZ17_01045, partial [Planctomycetaceae bacterium]